MKFHIGNSCPFKLCFVTGVDQEESRLAVIESGIQPACYQKEFFA